MRPWNQRSRRNRPGPAAVYDSGTISRYGCTEPSIFDTYPRCTRPVCGAQGASPFASRSARSSPSLRSSPALADLLGREELAMFQGIAHRLVEDARRRAKGRRPSRPCGRRGGRSRSPSSPSADSKASRSASGTSTPFGGNWRTLSGLLSARPSARAAWPRATSKASEKPTRWDMAGAALRVRGGAPILSARRVSRAAGPGSTVQARQAALAVAERLRRGVDAVEHREEEVVQRACAPRT